MTRHLATLSTCIHLYFVTNKTQLDLPCGGSSNQHILSSCGVARPLSKKSNLFAHTFARSTTVDREDQLATGLANLVMKISKDSIISIWRPSPFQVVSLLIAHNPSVFILVIWLTNIVASQNYFTQRENIRSTSRYYIHIVEQYKAHFYLPFIGWES